MTIADQPRFAWRGLLLDSARHMQSVAYVEHFIDWMALHKLNTFHWHLTDDQGWRIEIPGFPRLTTVGAWRQPVGPDALDAEGRPLARYGGFYTDAQIRAVVAFAAARHVTVVPEIDLPGHATALLASYPELAVPGVTPEPVTADYGLLPGVINVDEPTIAAVERILTQVMALFPGHYIHLGGDEVDPVQWHDSPAVQARMKALGLKDEDALERWLIGRFGAFVASHGRQLVGWDEVRNGEVDAGGAQGQQPVIMAWHKGPIAAQSILAGFRTIVAPAPLYYLDDRQNRSAAEPPGWTDTITTRAIYLHDPLPAGLTVAQSRLVLGMQGALWTERARKADWVTMQVWPRAAALAEVAWSPALTPLGATLSDTAADGAWADFARRLAVQQQRYPLVGLADGEAAEHAPGAAVTQAPDATHRVSLNLDLCDPNATELVVEAPREPLQAETPSSVGPLVRHGVRQLCWAWRGAALAGVGRIDLTLVHLPFHERLGSRKPILPLAPPRQPGGAIEVRLDRIDGPLLGSLPLAPFAAEQVHYAGTIALAGVPGAPRDLYFVVTGADIDSRATSRPPLTVIDTVTLH